MASITNQSDHEQWQERLWKVLKDLGFISDFFSWLFALLARLAEPLLMLSTMYVIAETAVPALHSDVLQALAIAIMVTVPEIVLPGSFVIASKARESGSRLAGLLYAMCWAFVVLMLLTIADVLVFHFIGLLLALLMFIRCGVAVGYSILMRVMHHGQSPVLTIAVPDVLATISELSEAVNEHTANTEQAINESEIRLSEHLQRTLTENEQRMSERFYRTLLELSQAVNERIERTSSELSERIDRTPNELLALPEISELTALPDVFERQLRITVTELKSSLKTNTETNRIVSSRLTNPKLPAVKTNTETNEMGKGEFVRKCLSEHPEMRNSDIQRTASNQGITLSPGYISDLRKAFTGELAADAAPHPAVAPAHEQEQV